MSQLKATSQGSQKSSQGIKQEVLSSEDELMNSARTLRSSQRLKGESVSEEGDVQLPQDDASSRRSPRRKQVKTEPLDLDSTLSSGTVEVIPVTPVTPSGSSRERTCTPRSGRTSANKREVEITDHKVTRGKYMFKVQERGGETRWLEEDYLATWINPSVGRGYLEERGLPPSKSPISGRVRPSRKVTSRSSKSVERSWKKVKKIKPEEGSRKPADVIDGQEYFMVEKIMGKREGENEDEFLIKWRHYGAKSNSWEPRSGVQATQLIRAYEEAQEESVST